MVCVVIPSQRLSVLLEESFSPAPHLGTFYWVVVKGKNGKKSFHGVCKSSGTGIPCKPGTQLAEVLKIIVNKGMHKEMC